MNEIEIIQEYKKYKSLLLEACRNRAETIIKYCSLMFGLSKSAIIDDVESVEGNGLKIRFLVKVPLQYKPQPKVFTIPVTALNPTYVAILAAEKEIENREKEEATKTARLEEKKKRLQRLEQECEELRKAINE